MKILLDVRRQPTEWANLKIWIDSQCEMHFELNGKYLFQVNCQEMEQAIRAFNI